MSSSFQRVYYTVSLVWTSPFFIAMDSLNMCKHSYRSVSIAPLVKAHFDGSDVLFLDARRKVSDVRKHVRVRGKPPSSQTVTARLPFQNGKKYADLHKAIVVEALHINNNSLMDASRGALQTLLASGLGKAQPSHINVYRRVPRSVRCLYTEYGEVVTSSTRCVQEGEHFG